MSQTIQTLLRQLRGTDPDGAASDADLLARFAAGRDGAAFAALVARHGPMILDVCRRLLGDEHDAEDAFQATFLVLARRAGQLRPADPVGAWLHGVACRTALHARGDRARRAARERRASTMPAADPTPAVLWADLRPVLDEEVGRLPAEYRVPVVLCYLSGKTYAEAAQEIGCPKGTVATRLAKAREVLRDRLTGRGLALPATGFAAVLAGHARAALPAPLFRATVEAATTTAASPAVAALTAEVLKAMTAPRLTTVAALLVAVVLAAAGTAAFAFRPADDSPVADVAPPAKAEESVRAEAPAVAAGPWSESVNGLRGRLVVAEGKAGERALYVELENVGPAGADWEVYFDPAELRGVLTRPDGRPAPAPRFGGPPAAWVALPYDSAAKLRASPAGFALPDGRLSATLTVDPAGAHGPANVWAGTLDLPAVTIPAAR